MLGNRLQHARFGLAARAPLVGPVWAIDNQSDLTTLLGHQRHAGTFVFAQQVGVSEIRDDLFAIGRQHLETHAVQVALVADNPGVWMFHCHVIDHMETGLMAAIEVS